MFKNYRSKEYLKEREKNGKFDEGDKWEESQFLIKMVEILSAVM